MIFWVGNLIYGYVFVIIADLVLPVMSERSKKKGQVTDKEVQARVMPYYNDFMALLSYLRVAPNAVIDIFAPYILYISQERFKNESVVKKCL